MVWKQDLAKLKQQLKQDEGPEPPARPAAPKRPDPPSGPKPLEEEDALFLQSMGQRPAPAPRPVPVPAPTALTPAALAPAAPATAPEAPAAPPAAPASFAEAMGQLKGMKPLDTRVLPPPLPAPPAPPQAAPQQAAPPPAAPQPARPPVPPARTALAASLLAASEETRPLDAPPPPPEALKPKGPVLIQLAAGMAIEVDGLLDLRNHTLSDARERLKERLEDAQHLGWRSLQVLLGPSEALKQGFLAFLTTPAARAVARYAQAPVPMGGAHAWILYLGPAQP